MAEEFKICFENYEISNLGNCRKKLFNGNYIIIKGSISNRGYKYFQVQRNGKRINNSFHVLVAKCFIGDRPGGLVIDHIDRNKLNNNVNNLRYISHVENLRNSDTYIDEIEEKDPILRNRANIKLNRKKNRDSKRFICVTCPLITNLKGVFGCKRDYDQHMTSKRHLHRINIINQMKNHDIAINNQEYENLKYQNDEYRRGRRKNNKPLIIW